jgi:CxxC motif-containing protein (DUF1111 family)
MALGLTLLLSASASRPPASELLLRLLRPAGGELTYEHGRYGDRLLDADPFRPDGHSAGAAASAVGRNLYFRDWLTVAGDAGPLAGPDLDASNCAACHSETAPHSPGVGPRVAVPVRANDEARYGPQLSMQHHRGEAPVARLQVSWEHSSFTYPDGVSRDLRRPRITATMRDGNRIPAAWRAAPLLFGWGLMAQVPTRTLSAFDDPQDRDGNGISGRVVWREGRPATLGWKNTQATLHDQIAGALRKDMGIDGPDAPVPEITQNQLDALVAYISRLGVPERRNSADGQRGEMLFGRAGCAACHVPAMITARHREPGFSEQLIWPYSDLALHDMGEELADSGDSPLAREWRTAPLWGLGLVEARLPARGFLHDGRARTLEEAILWHGGEAAASRRRFARLPLQGREALLRFVRSL